MYIVQSYNITDVLDMLCLIVCKQERLLCDNA